MRITFVLDHAGMSGGVRIVAGYAQRLLERGHDVFVISRHWSESGRIAKTKQRIERLLKLTDDPSHFDATDVPRKVLSTIRPVVDRDVPDADVVIATYWRTAQWVCDLSAAKGAKAYFMQDYGDGRGQPMDDVAATWRMPLSVITISQWLVDLMAEHDRIDDVDVVANAIDLAQFDAPPREKNASPAVGTVFTDKPQKGADIAIEAWRIARKTHADLRLVAFGTKDRTSPPHLPDEAEYHYMVDDDAIPGIYASCDAWLFASRREGYGLPLLEAMACRTPVIAAPGGAAPEVMSDGGGVLVPHDDPDAMAREICRMVDMPADAWRALSAEARANAEQHTWKLATDRFEAALERIVEQQGSKAVGAA